jgi:hypothetical protein
MKMVFSDSTAWMVRFPRVGMVCDDYTDEKVAKEVTPLSLIYNETKVPVPRVQAWGSAACNVLGLGPFIMDFINGVSVSDLLKDPNAERPTRLMREDISDSDIEVIYRQLANFLLQLFKLDFGSLPSLTAEAQSPTPTRPLTFKAHSILQNGGVDSFAPSTPGIILHILPKQNPHLRLNPLTINPLHHLLDLLPTLVKLKNKYILLSIGSYSCLRICGAAGEHYYFVGLRRFDDF